MPTDSTPNRDSTYTVPNMSCGHCKAAVSDAVSAVGGVESVEVDLDSHRVVVGGAGFSDDDVRAAVEGAGYEVTQS